MTMVSGEVSGKTWQKTCSGSTALFQKEVEMGTAPQRHRIKTVVLWAKAGDGKPLGKELFDATEMPGSQHFGSGTASCTTTHEQTCTRMVLVAW